MPTVEEVAESFQCQPLTEVLVLEFRCMHEMHEMLIAFAKTVSLEALNSYFRLFLFIIIIIIIISFSSFSLPFEVLHTYFVFRCCSSLAYLLGGLVNLIGLPSPH
eukprot:gene12454-8542_t